MDMAREFIKSAYLPKVHLGQVLTEAQINTLRDAVDRPDARLPLDSVDFGTRASQFILGKFTFTERHWPTRKTEIYRHSQNLSVRGAVFFNYIPTRVPLGVCDTWLSL